MKRIAPLNKNNPARNPIRKCGVNQANTQPAPWRDANKNEFIEPPYNLYKSWFSHKPAAGGTPAVMIICRRDAGSHDYLQAGRLQSWLFAGGTPALPVTGFLSRGKMTGKKYIVHNLINILPLQFRRWPINNRQSTIDTQKTPKRY